MKWFILLMAGICFPAIPFDWRSFSWCRFQVVAYKIARHNVFANPLFVCRRTNNNIAQNIFDIFSKEDLVISTQDLVVKNAFSSWNERCFERVLGLFIRKFPPESFCFLTSPTSPFLPGLCGRALSGCRWGWCQGDVERRHHPKTSFLLKYLTNYKTL